MTSGRPIPYPGNVEPENFSPPPTYLNFFWIFFSLSEGDKGCWNYVRKTYLVRSRVSIRRFSAKAQTPFSGISSVFTRYQRFKHMGNESLLNDNNQAGLAFQFPDNILKFWKFLSWFFVLSIVVRRNFPPPWRSCVHLTWKFLYLCFDYNSNLCFYFYIWPFLKCRGFFGSDFSKI